MRMTNYDKQNPAGSDIGGGISGRRRADEIRGFLKQATGAFEDAGTRKRWGAGVPGSTCVQPARISPATVAEGE